MPMLTHCCCSRNLRNATIVCAIWSLLASVLSVGFTIRDIQKSYTVDGYYISDTGLIIIAWINLIVTLFAVFSAVMLIVAVFKRKPKLMVPWMVLVAMLIILDAVHTIYNILLDGFSSIIIAMLLLWFIFTIISIYSELCVLSHYQEVKIGRGHTNDYNPPRTHNSTEVQHVHITETPFNYVQSQHTVYSFHSQTLCEEEGGDSLKLPTTAQNGHPKTALSKINGRVLELRPVASMPSDMENRLKGNGYTGSMEMKVIDSIPVTFDRTADYTGSLEIAPVTGKRPRRFRTVSESAVVRQQLLADSKASGATSSLKNIGESDNANVQQQPSSVQSSSDSSDLAPNHSKAETEQLINGEELHD
ncbi:uncharacterized protein [Watersipora subatra]|uniref:uncharacterized protein n=1 Tax=Watersipora subatra TaxID=2589382 RepID=UPI00355C5312